MPSHSAIQILSAVSLTILGACSSEVAVMAPGASTPTDSVPAPADSFVATFSPLVGEIAFVSDRDGSPFIYVAAANGSNLRRLAQGRHPAWSPDARQIFFYGLDSGVANPPMHVINADGSGEHVLSPGTQAVLSPDGSRLAFTTELGLYVGSSDGSNPTLLVSSDFQRPGEAIEGAAWSPDGKRIAFVSGDWDLFGFGIYVANVDGSGVFGTVSPGSSPRWSPDGSMIAFSTTVFTYFPGNGPHSPSAVFEIGVAKPDGSALRLVSSRALVGHYFDWSPDGRSLLLSGHRIFETDTTFQVARQLVPDAVAPTLRTYSDYDAVWSRVAVP